MPEQTRFDAFVETKSSMIEVSLGNAYDASEYAGLENYLTNLPGVQSVHLLSTGGVNRVSVVASKSRCHPEDPRAEVRNPAGVWCLEEVSRAPRALVLTLLNS